MSQLHTRSQVKRDHIPMTTRHPRLMMHSASPLPLSTSQLDHVVSLVATSNNIPSNVLQQHENQNSLWKVTGSPSPDTHALRLPLANINQTRTMTRIAHPISFVMLSTCTDGYLLDPIETLLTTTLQIPEKSASTLLKTLHTHAIHTILCYHH